MDAGWMDKLDRWTEKAASHISATAIVVLLLVQSAASFSESSRPGDQVHFERVRAAEDVKFARQYLGKYLSDDRPLGWNLALDPNLIKMARADLNDDGSAEVFIFVEDSLWCGSIGCQGILLQKRRGQWTLMEEPYISEEATVVLPEKRFGYHKLYTAQCIYTFRHGKTYEILNLETDSIIR